MPPKTPTKLAKDIQSDSSSSPDSSDSEFGAKTLMRKVRDYTAPIGDFGHKINDHLAEVVTADEIAGNPGKYFVANFKGDHLSYFDSNTQRRRYVKSAVEGISTGQSPDYKSIARSSIEKKYDKDLENVKAEITKLNITKKLGSVETIKTYKSPQHFVQSVGKIGGDYGNPFISTSKDNEVTQKYADHPDPKEGEQTKEPHPRYGYDPKKPKKPKHRLIGMATVFVHEANEYLRTEKADIENLRKDGQIGGKNAVERNNQEIIFADQISSRNIAGYVPLTYPNLDANYDSSDEKLFGLDKVAKNPIPTRKEPKTLGDKAKTETIYPATREFQWKIAMRSVKERNPDGELLWVDNEGKFRRFTPKQGQKLVSDEFQAELVRKRNEEDKSQEHLGEVRKKLDLDEEFSTPKKQEPAKKPEAKTAEGLALEQISRVSNPDAYYADDEVNALMEANLVADVQYITPAISKIKESLSVAIQNFIQNTAKTHAVIMICNDNHYTAIHIERSGEEFVITYVDPTVNIDSRKPLHDISQTIMDALSDNFEKPVNIIKSSSMIQYNHLDGDKVNIDNVHCGAFTCEIMLQMTKGSMKINPNNNRIQELTKNESWNDIDLNEYTSNKLGLEIRRSHENFLRGDFDDNKKEVKDSFGDLGVKFSEMQLSPKASPTKPEAEKLEKSKLHQPEK